jgi:hypothetical protein
LLSSPHPVVRYQQIGMMGSGHPRQRHTRIRASCLAPRRTAHRRGPPHRYKGRRVQGGLRSTTSTVPHEKGGAFSSRFRAPRGLRNRRRIDSGRGRRAMARRSQGTLPSHYPHPHHRSAHPPTLRKTVEALSACTTDSATRVKTSAARAMPRCLYGGASRCRRFLAASPVWGSVPADGRRAAGCGGCSAINAQHPALAVPGPARR